MTTALMCLLIVAILPYVFTGAGAYLRIKQFGSLDDQQPRVQALELRGTGARAYAAQHNAWEALAFFASADVVTHLVGVDPAKTALPLIIFVVARVLHGIVYIANLAALRTLIFVIGTGCVLHLFYLAITA